jgi:hypothetical protein
MFALSLFPLRAAACHALTDAAGALAYMQHNRSLTPDMRLTSIAV